MSIFRKSLVCVLGPVGIRWNPLESGHPQPSPSPSSSSSSLHHRGSCVTSRGKSIGRTPISAAPSRGHRIGHQRKRCTSLFVALAMTKGLYDALVDDDSTDNETSTHNKEGSAGHRPVVIPSYEDLSVARADEETVLEAVYGDDFTRRDGKGGYAQLSVRVRPPDIERERVGSELT